MKQILTLALLALALSATAQTTALDYYALWITKSNQLRLELLTYEVAADILATPADSTYVDDALAVTSSANLDSYVVRYTREAVKRKANPAALTDTVIKNALRDIFIKDYWGRQRRAGVITKQEYYTNTQ